MRGFQSEVSSPRVAVIVGFQLGGSNQRVAVRGLQSEGCSPRVAVIELQSDGCKQRVGLQS